MTFNAVDNPFKLSENTAFINFSRNNTIDASKIKIEAGTEITAYSQYNQGSVEIKKINKNFANLIDAMFTDGNCTLSNIQTDSFTVKSTGPWARCIVRAFKLPQNKDYVVSAKFLETLKEQSIVGFGILGNTEDDFYSATEFVRVSTVTINKDEAKRISAQFNTSNYSYIYIRIWTNCTADTVNSTIDITDFMIEQNTELSDYALHEEDDYILPIQKPMLQGDYFVKEADGWKEVHGWNKRTFTSGFIMQYGTSLFNLGTANVTNQNLDNHDAICDMFKFETRTSNMTYLKNHSFAMQPQFNSIFFKEESCATAEEFNAKLAELNSAGNPLTVYYKTQTPNKIACTEAQSEVLDQLSELELFKGTNNIITAENLALMQMTYTVDMKAYIDSKIANTNAQILND